MIANSGNLKPDHKIIVVGAGHAGCEAALIAAKMNCSVLLLTLNLDNIAQMSCNPSIGGLGKGQIVREIDALGGYMAKITDMTGIQFRILNKSKGPAVQSPRAQCDKKLYQFTMKHILEKTENIDLKQEEVVKIITDHNKVCGVLTKTNTLYPGDAVIVTTGTFLNGLIYIGLKNFKGGRNGEISADYLSNSLTELGFEVKRLKTGTPPRINAKTIDYSKLEVQYGDEPPVPFSHFTQKITSKQLPCYITYTNEEIHKLILDNLDRSPLYTGIIKGIGPRYCPSIEDKVVRFKDKTRHQIFLEPEGYNTQEIYCNGISTSLPEDIQEKIVHLIPGCEYSKIMRYGYAIEYDFCPPTQLKPTLETKLIDNLYFAGQINGTTGYEEAAAQGLIAGINAVLKLRQEQPFILRRDEAYIGVLIDDIVTKGVMDPYRIFTSRAEYRLLLRQDNADLRLMNYAHKFGTIPTDIYEKFLKYKDEVYNKIENLEKIYIEPNISVSHFIRQGHTLDEALNKINNTVEFSKDEDLLPWTQNKLKQEIEIEIKYAGYIKAQLEEIEKFKKFENKKIPENLDYSKIPGLLTEAKIKLEKIKPLSIGQASRISGVTLSDISILLVYLNKYKKFFNT